MRRTTTRLRREPAKQAEVGRTSDRSESQGRNSPAKFQFHRDPPKVQSRMGGGRSSGLERVGSEAQERRWNYRNTVSTVAQFVPRQSDNQASKLSSSPRIDRLKRAPTLQDAQRMNALVKRVQAPKALPLIERQIDQLLTTLDKNLTLEGLHRISGSSVQIKACAHEFETGKVVQLDSPHDASGLLKQLFASRFEGGRGDTLIPMGMQYDMVTLYERLSKEGGESAPHEIARWLLGNLPAPNKCIFLRILAHLKKVADNAELNKMTASNLAVVFGPKLCDAPSAENPQVLLRYGTAFSRIMQVLIEDFKA